MAEIKSFKTYQELIQKMRDRGLIIQDENKVLDFLMRVNYYRFSAYFLTYKIENKFYEGTTFENILELYNFDVELRILLLKHIAEIEIFFRNAISHELGEKFGPLGYLVANNFDKSNYHDDFITSLNECINQSNEIFIKHYTDKYNCQYPIWVAIQTLTITPLSKLYSNMLKTNKSAISRKYFNKPYKIIDEWFKAVTDLRNICAHWARLYNRPMPGVHLDKKIYPIEIINNQRVFAHIIAVFNLLPSAAMREELKDDFKKLLLKYPTVDLKYLGCNGEWMDYMYVQH